MARFLHIRLSALCFWLLALGLSSLAAESRGAEALTTSKAIQQLSRTNAAKALPVRMRGVVSLSYRPWRMMFVQDEFGGVFCDTSGATENPPLGRSIEVEGTTAPGAFLPIVIATHLNDLGPGTIPKARDVTPSEFWTGRDDGDLVRLRGYVISEKVKKDGGLNEQMSIRAGSHEVTLQLFDTPVPEAMREPYALLEVVGVACAEADASNRLKSMGVAIQDPSAIKLLKTTAEVLKEAEAANYEALKTDAWKGITGPTRFQGVVTLSTTNEIWLGSKDLGLSVDLTTEDRLQPGEKVEVVGFLQANGQGMKLAPGRLLSRAPGTVIPPIVLPATSLSDRAHFGKRVQVEGEFMHRIPSQEGDLLVLRQGDESFEIRLRHPRHRLTLQNLRGGAYVRAVGVLWQQSSGLEGKSAPRVLVGTPNDFKILTPSPWPLSRTLAVVVGLLVALGIGLLALTAAHQRLRRTLRELATADRERASLTRELESRIESRTAELQSTNEKLKVEIIERQHAEAAVRDREASLRDAQRLSHLGSFSWDAQTNQVTWSQELYRVYGQDPDSFVPDFQKYLEQIHPEDRPRVEQAVYAAFANKATMSHDYRVVRPSGEIRWVSANGEVTLNSKGEPIGLEGTCQDITDRKQAEEQLAQSEKRFRLLVEGTEVIVWEFDLAAGKFTYISPQAKRLGYPLEEWLKPNFWENHIHPEDRDRAVRFCIENIDRGLSHRFQYRMMTASGEFVWLDDVVTVESPAESKGAIRGVMIDITERKQSEAMRDQLEARLRQSQKMEAVGTLAGGIAHDFNNILGSIIGYTQLAIQDSADQPELREHLTLSLKASHRARDLVQQILTFSRPQTQEATSVQLVDLIAETTKLLRVTMPSHIELTTQTPEWLPEIAADASLIQQVLMNLAKNAVHSMERMPHGRLTIVAKPRTLSKSSPLLDPGVSPGPHVELTISDTGCGIPADSLPRIFDPFFTTKAPGEGTGLGLSMVHGIVKRHHGAIRVQSEEGKGTTFQIYLPTQKGARSTPPKPKIPLGWSGTKQVLFVDDEVSLCQVGKRLLERAGCQVTVQTTAEAALELLQRPHQRFDLMITDLSMPGMSGLGLIRELRVLYPDLPVILTTGHADSTANEEARALGVVEILMKPNDAETLLAAVQRAVAGSSTVSQP